MAENTVLLGFRARNIRGYENGECSFSFVTERIADEDKAESAYSPFSRALYDRKISAVYGINSSGKSTLLSLIRFVLSVYLCDKDLDDSHSLLRRFHDGKDIIIDAAFSSRGRICMIHSEITEEDGGFVFKEEILYELQSNAPLSIKVLNDFSSYSELARRSSLPDDMKTFLKQDQSIARLSIAEKKQGLLRKSRLSEQPLFVPSYTYENPWLVHSLTSAGPLQLCLQAASQKAS